MLKNRRSKLNDLTNMKKFQVDQISHISRHIDKVEIFMEAFADGSVS